MALFLLRGMGNENFSPEPNAMPTIAQQPEALVEKREIETMALVLEGRHGIYAAGVADFLSAVHEQSRDRSRCSAWAEVARTVRYREHLRTSDHARLHRM